MSRDHSDVLREVFSRVAESLAFMFAEVPEEDEFLDRGGPYVEARMGFIGPFKGTIAIAVEQSMCPEIAANVLGLDPGDELVTKQPCDALKELLNVTCGNVLTTLAGEDPIFDLTVPEVTPLDAAAWQAFKNSPGALPFMVDDNPVVLQLSIEGDA